MKISQLVSLGIIGSSKSFDLEIVTTTPNQTFTLPLVNGGTYNFNVQWGDTGQKYTVTSYNDANRIHSYANPGTYKVSMEGICTRLAFNNSGDRLLVKRLLNVIDMGFTILNFNGCANLTYITGNLNRLKSLTTIVSMFEGCKSLTTIPAGIFDGSIGITDFDRCFAYCGLTSIPTDLFRYNTSVKWIRSTFSGCANLTSIPVDLFRYNILVGNFEGIFYGCTGLTSLPTDLFRYNILVGSFYLSFVSCTGLTSLPTDLFRYNTAANNFIATFGGCNHLTSLPTDLFRYNPAVNFTNTFMDCSGLISIPIDLFRYNTVATVFTNLFRNCTSLTSIPTDLFRYNTLATDFAQTFYNCLKVQFSADIFYPAGEQGIRFLNKSVNFSNCFLRTSFNGIQGTAPDLWNCNFGTGTPIRTGCYSGAGNNVTSLSNYADIPVAWK